MSLNGLWKPEDLPPATGMNNRQWCMVNVERLVGHTEVTAIVTVIVQWKAHAAYRKGGYSGLMLNL